MARIPNGILGEFVGSAGNVSGYMRMGTNFLRSKRTGSKLPMSPKRLAQQQKIKVCNAFTKPFSGSGFFDATFPLAKGTATGYNKATSALLKKAIEGMYPDTFIAWPQVLISEGGMPSPREATASVDLDGNIIFNWINNSGTGTAKANDKAVLVAYCPATQQAAFGVTDNYRECGHTMLNAQSLKGNSVETWMGFISSDGRDAANSVYTGALVV
ncbi:MAG: DUF6266 family protein [Gammaproteobacteria bacterium]